MRGKSRAGRELIKVDLGVGAVGRVARSAGLGTQVPGSTSWSKLCDHSGFPSTPLLVPNPDFVGLYISY